MKLIFATDKNFGIGLNGDMLFHIPEDLARFRSITEGHIVVMGRKTLESLPNSQPLKNRINVIVSRKDLSLPENCYQVKDIDDLKPLLDEINPNKEMTEFLIGGGQLVADLIKECDCAMITMVDHEFTMVDTWIPNLDSDKNWTIVSESEPHTFENYTFTYREYERHYAVD